MRTPLLIVSATLVIAGCASAPSDSPPATPSLMVPTDSEGLVLDYLETAARRQDFLPPETDDPTVEPEVIPENQVVFLQRLEIRDYPLYKSQYANQVAFDPQWKITFDFEPEGTDSLRVVGRAWIRNREPPAGDWNEHPVKKGNVIESLNEILEEVERLLQ